MPDRKLRLGEELISPLHALYDGLQVDGAPRPAHRAAEHPVWVVTRYRDARKVLNHPGVRRDARQAAELYAKRTGSPRAGIGEGLSHHMLNLDPPDHTRLRSLVYRAFTPRQVERLQPHIERITEELLDAMAWPRTGRPDGRLRDPADHRGDLRAAGHSRGRARTRPPVLGAPGGTAVAGGGPGPGRCAGRLPARAARGQAPAAVPTTSTAGWCRPPTRAAN